METGSRIMVTMGWGQGYNGDFLFNEYRDSIWADEKVLKMDSGDGCTTVDDLMLLNYT